MTIQNDSPHQVGVLPFRREGEHVEICLIRKLGRKKWKIPKGFIDAGDTAEQAALKEVLEEAGLVGRIVGDSVGIYEYVKGGVTFSVVLYVLAISEQHGSWSEMHLRERRWYLVHEAESLLAKHPVRSLLKQAADQFMNAS